MRRRVVTALVLGGALFFGSNAAFAQMSEGEKKASARAAFSEGVDLQDKGKPADALRRFEAAESLFDAPTHLLHIAECQALTGKLVEAQETYSTLDKKDLGASPPDAFKQAQSQGRAELQVLRPRVPSLRIVLHPDAQTLQSPVVTLNDQSIPANVAIVARPVNPGPYRISATATGFATPNAQSIVLGEKEQRTVELTLVQGAQGANAAAAATPVVTPPPAPYGQPQPSAPPPPYEQATNAKPRPTTVGLLFGGKVGVFVPGGSVYSGQKFGNYSSAGGGFGLDASLRFARIFLAGLSYEWANIGGAETTRAITDAIPSGASLAYSTHLNYFGVNIGIVPNIDRFSFVADVGLGYRWLNRTTTLSGAGSASVSGDQSFGGGELVLNAGLSIPVGPIRLVPKAGVALGEFDSLNCGTPKACNGADTASHAIFNISLGIVYSLDLGKKKVTASFAPAATVASNGR